MSTISLETHEQICADLRRMVHELILESETRAADAYKRGYWQAVEDVLHSGIETIIANNTEQANT